MRKFLFKLIYFTCILSIFYFLLEVAFRVTPNEYSTKLANFETAVNDVEVLILGSSHALNAINPHLFEKNAYSMAMVAQGIQMDHDIFFRYKNDLKNLKSVIISISHFSLSRDIFKGGIGSRLPFYRVYYDLNYKNNKFNVFDYSLSHGIGYRAAVINVLRYLRNPETKVKCDNKGWLGGSKRSLAKKKPEKLINISKDVADRHENESVDFTYNLKLLRNIIEECNKNDVKVHLIETPKIDLYNDYTDKYKAELVDKSISNLAESFPNVYYKDYSNLYKNEYTFFKDPDHMNGKGSKVFTSKLVNDFKSLNNL